MKSLAALMLFICIFKISFSQKKSIDTSDFGKWPTVSMGALSADGRYVCYTIWNPATSTSQAGIKSIDSKWEFIIESQGFKFTDNSKIAVFKGAHDSLGILELTSRKVSYISNVTSFKVPDNQNNKWLAYQGRKQAKNLTLRNLETNEEQFYTNITDFNFNVGGSLLLIAVSDSNQHSRTKELKLINLQDNKTTTIWTNGNASMKCGGFVFSKVHPCLAFTVEESTSNKTIKSIWYYRTGIDKAFLLTKVNADSNLSIAGIDSRGFSNNGNNLFIQLIENDTSKLNPDIAQMDIWSYKDSILQSKQLMNLEKKTYSAVINVQNHQISRLEYVDDKVISWSNDFAIVANLKGEWTADEWYWNKLAGSSVCLVSFNDGKRTTLNKNICGNIALNYWISPAEKYVIYYDPLSANYFSYEIATKIRRNITSTINTSWTRYDKRDIAMYPFMPVYSAGAGWIRNDLAILLYDQSDIYQVDPSGKISPINLTKGIGRTNNIEFRVAMEKFNQTFSSGDSVILSAFNRTNKNDGFYSITLGNGRGPVLLTSGPYIYKGTKESERFTTAPPIKARDTGIYLLKRMSTEESPNYFWTSDFKTFKSVTEVHPERNFNWITTELITWKTFDGIFSQGILYKPKDFNPNKRYPIIFNYYERVSNDLNAFMPPHVAHGEINIPYFVSNGFLVFTPDIHYKIGHPGNSVVNTVLSAVNILAKRPYIDTSRMGLQGHSRGGWETNFLVTHTNKFAAAVSAAGFVDYVSLYNGVLLRATGSSRQTAYEIGHQRIGATLWERPDLYIENSPIFRANKVQTPLLLMNNKDDGDVPFEQGVEFFTALRRLGKKVWMLQYDGEDHVLFNRAAYDFTIRMQQFFNHYLKSAPPPIWMSQGIPAKLKSIQTGYPLDPSGSCSPTCHICLSWNTKMKNNPLSTLQEIQTRKQTEHWQ